MKNANKVIFFLLLVISSGISIPFLSMGLNQTDLANNSLSLSPEELFNMDPSNPTQILKSKYRLDEEVSGFSTAKNSFSLINELMDSDFFNKSFIT